MPTIEFTPLIDSEPVLADPIVITPVFYGNGRQSDPCLTLVVKDSAGAVASRYLIVVDGKHLTLELQDRSRPVLSALERKLLEEKRAAAAAENAAG